MPEFMLKRPSSAAHAYYGLSEFARGYVEAMFFTNGDTGDAREDLLNELGVERLTKSSVAAIARDCNEFLSSIMPDGCFARQWIDRLTECETRPSYGDGCIDDRRAGHFFWYARQGHGVAWRDDYSPDDEGRETADGLQNKSREMGECYVEVSRGWIHIR